MKSLESTFGKRMGMPSVEHRFRTFALLVGIGMLLSQIVWNRQLLLLVGGSVDAAASVLAAVMLGLGTGGKFWGRKAELSPKPQNLLRLITISAAGFSLVPLAATGVAASLYPLLYSSFLSIGPVRLVISLVLVFPATFFAGGFIPVLGRMVEGRGGDLEISKLYGINALGSAVGGFLAGFVLLELLGSTFTLIAAFLVTGATVMLIPAKSGVPAPASPRAESTKTGIPLFFLVIYFFSGMFSLGYEMVWTRQLSYALGNSTYAFALMGIMVLAGIGIGSLIGQRIARSVSRPRVAFGYAEICLAVAAILPLTVIRHFGSLVSILGGSSWESRTAASFVVAMAYMLPSTACMGATFPLIVRSTARNSRLGEDIGTLSLFNCMGAALGPVLASQLLFRIVGVTVSGAILAAGSVFLGLLVLVREKSFRAVIAVPVALALVLFLTLTTSPPGSVPPPGTELLFFREDRNATLSVFGREWDGYRSLRINGVEEVPVDQASLEAFYLLGHLPWGYNPRAGDVMVVAMGGGITSGALLTHSIDELVCVELCPAVVEAAPIFASENLRPDLDPRFTLIGDDGRNYLLGTDRLFDLIVCDATHPASADSWVLYTREFYEIVLDRLEPGGVAAQWVPLHQLPTRELVRILATWARVFPESSVHLAGGRHAILIGSTDALNLSIADIFDEPAAAAQLESVGFSEETPCFIEPIAGTADLGLLEQQSSDSNSDDRSYCQFMARRLPADPQATIQGDVAMLLSLSGSTEVHELHLGQMAYWDGRLPDAVELFRRAADTAMGRRWLSVALTTAAEELWNEGRGEEAIPLLSEALLSDPGWDRPDRLIAMIENR